MDKSIDPVATVVENGEVTPDTYVGEKSGTVRDMDDMKRLGKQQVFKVGVECPFVCIPC